MNQTRWQRGSKYVTPPYTHPYAKQVDFPVFHNFIPVNAEGYVWRKIYGCFRMWHVPHYSVPSAGTQRQKDTKEQWEDIPPLLFKADDFQQSFQLSWSVSLLDYKMGEGFFPSGNNSSNRHQTHVQWMAGQTKDLVERKESSRGQALERAGNSHSVSHVKAEERILHPVSFAGFQWRHPE